ncbi:MAG: carboxypeptidase-like regulatory domain-containing protein [Clostridiales bacterium]|jgi:hypothetical protein|nr:carboxypeptidase-like regulatory domain-containing protein [Clostridiales bacterium]
MKNRNRFKVFRGINFRNTRRSIALFLALILIMALAPVVVSASSTVTVYDRGSTSYYNTVFVERTANVDPMKTDFSYPRNLSGGVNVGSDTTYAQNAAYLIVNIQDGIATGEQFKIAINGGSWALGDYGTGSTNTYGAPRQNIANGYSDGNVGSGYDHDGDSADGWHATDTPNLSVYYMDRNKGQYLAPGGPSSEGVADRLNLDVGGQGTYVRYGTQSVDYSDFANEIEKGTAVSPDGYFGLNGSWVSTLPALDEPSPVSTARNKELPYTMAFTSSTSATITVLQEAVRDDNPIVVIPMLLFAAQNTTVTAQVIDDISQGNLSITTSAPVTVAAGVTGTVEYSVSPNISSNELFPITTLTLSETRAGTMRQRGYLEIAVPIGYSFVTDYFTEQLSTVGGSIVYSQAPNRDDYASESDWFVAYMGYWFGQIAGNVTIQGYDITSSAITFAVGGGFKGNPTLVSASFRAGRNGIVDASAVRIEWANLGVSGVTPGELQIRNLPLMLKVDENPAVVSYEQADVNVKMYQYNEDGKDQYGNDKWAVIAGGVSTKVGSLSRIITGTVTLDGESVYSALVSLRQGGNLISTQITDNDGKYIFNDLPPGNFDLKIEYIKKENGAFEEIESQIQSANFDLGPVITLNLNATRKPPTQPGTNPFTGSGNEIIINKQFNNANGEPRYDVTIRWKNNGNITVDEAVFSAEIPASLGFTNHGGLVTIEDEEITFNADKNIKAAKEGHHKFTVESPSDIVDVQVFVTYQGVKYPFGKGIIAPEVEVEFNAPAQAKMGETFTVYGVANTNGTIFIKNAINGDTLAQTQVDGRWYTAEVVLNSPGTHYLVAEIVTLSGSKKVSETSKIEILEKPISLQWFSMNNYYYYGFSSSGVSYGFYDLYGTWHSYNIYSGLPSFSIWTNPDLSGVDFSPGAYFINGEFIESLTYHFFGKDYPAAKTSDGVWAAEINGWQGTGFQRLTATLTTTNGTTIPFTIAEITVLIDPSGYVYNSVTGDMISGAEVTCEISTDNGATWQEWDAERYGQINPQITGDDGKYGWMVPEGLYRVKVSKDGFNEYVTTDDPTIPEIIIPPVRDDVFIALTPNSFDVSGNRRVVAHILKDGDKYVRFDIADIVRDRVSETGGKLYNYYKSLSENGKIEALVIAQANETGDTYAAAKQFHADYNALFTAYLDKITANNADITGAVEAVIGVGVNAGDIENLEIFKPEANADGTYAVSADPAYEVDSNGNIVL